LQDYKEDLSLEDALKLVIKVLSKTMDSTSLTADKLELSSVRFFFFEQSQGNNQGTLRELSPNFYIIFNSNMC
jgi:20S proteasome alpha/beta subunit